MKNLGMPKQMATSPPPAIHSRTPLQVNAKSKITQAVRNSSRSVKPSDKLDPKRHLKRIDKDKDEVKSELLNSLSSIQAIKKTKGPN